MEKIFFILQRVEEFKYLFDRLPQNILKHCSELYKYNKLTTSLFAYSLLDELLNKFDRSINEVYFSNNGKPLIENGYNVKEVTINEELIVMTMLSCTELYEMVLSNSENVSTCELKEIETFSSNMVTIYANLIKRELKTLEDIPPHIKSEVEEVLKND